MIQAQYGTFRVTRCLTTGVISAGDRWSSAGRMRRPWRAGGMGDGDPEA